MDRKGWCGGALSAALFSRSEPYREGLGETQTTAARGQGTNQRNPRSGHHRGSAMHNTRQCKGLVRTRSERSTVKRKMLYPSTLRPPASTAPSKHKPHG